MNKNLPKRLIEIWKQQKLNGEALRRAEQRVEILQMLEIVGVTNEQLWLIYKFVVAGYDLNVLQYATGIQTLKE